MNLSSDIPEGSKDARARTLEVGLMSHENFMLCMLSIGRWRSGQHRSVSIEKSDAYLLLALMRTAVCSIARTWLFRRASQWDHMAPFSGSKPSSIICLTTPRGLRA